MELEKRKERENIFLDNKLAPYIEDLNEQKLSLRRKTISKILKIKRMNKLEQMKSSLDIINKALQFEINKFSSCFNIIISYLQSSDNNILYYTLNQLCTYFKYNEPDIKEQKMIIEGQFLEILLNLGINFLKQKNIENLILIIWIFINIQIYKEGNGEYIENLYNEKFFDFYNECFCSSYSEEITNEIILLLHHITQISNDLNIKVLNSKVFNSIIFFILNEELDLEFSESIIKLIIACLNISQNYEPNELEINLIDKCLIILKTESEKDNEKIQKLCYKGLYNISKLNDKYEFNIKMIQHKIPLSIMKIKNKDVKKLLYELKTLTNILAVSDDYLGKINLKELILYYNEILNLYDDDDKIVNIILNGIINIADSKYAYVIESSVVWNEEKIQKYFSKNENIQLLFIKIVKYIINIGNYYSLNFIYKTKVLEYLIYLISNSNTNVKIIRKILKIVDNYLDRFKSNEKANLEYIIIYNKFINWMNLFIDEINEENDVFEYIKEKYKYSEM